MLYDRFRQFLVDERLDLSGHVLVGISGGVDSIVLVDLVRRLASTVTCLHVNYGLRGEESDEDEAFVRDFCDRESVDLVVFDARGEMKRAGGVSTQALARQIRYREYVAEALRTGIDLVLLGHHADDQVETVLLNLFRGTGLNGLAGMPVVRPAGEQGIQIARPLLFARRKDIEDYAHSRGLSWRDDSSNDNPVYRRVALRREILPLVERHFGSAAAENILRTADLARQMVAARYTPVTGRDEEAGNTLDLETLERLPGVVRTQTILDALARMLPDAPRSRAVVRQIETLIRCQTGRRVQLRGGAVIRERTVLRFLEDDSPVDTADNFEVPLVTGGANRVPGGVVVSLQLEEPPAALDAGSPNIAYLDADVLKPPLSVTEWRPGDRIRPFGTAGTKKVSDLLTDEKIPTSKRARIPVLRSGDQIAWIVGVRPSADFAVSAGTASVVALVFIPDPVS